MCKAKNSGTDCGSKSVDSPSKVISAQPDSEESMDTLYKYIYERSEKSFNAEIERENSLIHQSGQMQAAFSFVIAGIFMALPVMMDNRGKLSDNFFFVAVSAITFFLLLSLLTASLAAFRYKYESWKSVDETKEAILTDPNWQNNLSAYNRYNSLINDIGKMEASRNKLNNKRAKFIRLSMISFIFSIALIVIFYSYAFAILWL